MLSSEQELALEVEPAWSQLLVCLCESVNLYEIVELLGVLVKRSHIETTIRVADDEVSLATLLEEVYGEAGRLRLWGVVRRASALLGKADPDLDYAVSAILVRQKTVQVGRAFSAESFITQPLPSAELLHKIDTLCRDDVRDRVLTQELLIYLGLLIKAEPELFADLLTVRVSHLILLLTSVLAYETNSTQDEAYEQLMHLAPSTLQERLVAVLTSTQSLQIIVTQLEALQAQQGTSTFTWSPDQALEALPTPPQGWHEWRRFHGILSRVPGDFYEQVWQLFRHSHGLVIGDKFERRNRLDSRTILSDMTPGETAFALRVEHLLSKIPAPEYRQVNFEALLLLSDLARQNPTLYIDDTIVLDVLIGHAVRLAYLQRHPTHEERYADHKAAAWNAFYALPPIVSTDYLARAFRFLIEVKPSAD